MPQDIKRKWKQMGVINHTATEKAVPFIEQKNKDRWWDYECTKETELRNVLRIKAGEEHIHAYNEQRKKSKELYRQRKEPKMN